MSHFIGFLSAPNCQYVRARVRALTLDGRGCRVVRTRDRRVTLCLVHSTHGGENGRPELIVWQDANGTLHLERRASSRERSWGDGERVWLGYEPHVGRLRLGRSLTARETIYYARHPASGAIVFSNALPPVLHLTGAWRDLSTVGLAFYLGLWGVPAPWTLFERVWKVGPGRSVEIRLGKPLPIPETGASLPVARRGRLRASELRKRIEGEVCEGGRGVDAPGIVLSGGLDSSVVAAVLADASERQLEGFTLLYRPDSPLAQLNWDAEYAREVASELGIPLRTLVVDERTSGWAMAGFLLRHSDEPVADPAIVPLFLLANSARANGCFHLWDGRGADELFAMGHSYWKLLAWWWSGRVPQVLKSWARRWIGAPEWNSKDGKWFAPTDAESALWYEYLLEPSELERLLPGFPRDVLSSYFDELAKRAGDERAPGLAQRSEWEIWFAEQNQRMMDVLTKVTGVHFHSPFASESVVRFAFSVPLSARMPWFRDKALVRRAFGSMVPRRVLRRRKRGLATPALLWLERAKPFLGRYLRELHDLYGNAPVRWDEVGRWLEEPGRDPGYSWLLMTLVLWLHGHAVGRVPEIPVGPSDRSEVERELALVG